MNDKMKQLAKTDVVTRALVTADEHGLFTDENACLLMVSGGSDSTALAYVAAELRDEGRVGPLAMLHVDHKLRGKDAEEDAKFASELAASLDIPFFLCEIDIAKEASRSGENIEAVARRERYLAANEALMSLCQHSGIPFSDGRILTAHTCDDRIENFYMRSIVGTGPGGLRSMLYKNGPVVRPLLDLTREELRAFIEARRGSGLALATDDEGMLWREDATNAHTDRFRAYVRHEIVPKAKDWMPQMPANLVRSMNLIADEDDMLDEMTTCIMEEDVLPLGVADAAADAATDAATSATADIATDPNDAEPSEATFSDADHAQGFLLKPSFAYAYLPLQRRAVHRLLKAMLGAEERIDASSVEAVLAGFETDVEGGAKPKGGYVANIQGNLAVSANKKGVRVEPMEEFRRRRNKL